MYVSGSSRSGKTKINYVIVLIVLIVRDIEILSRLGRPETRETRFSLAVPVRYIPLIQELLGLG